MKEEIVGFRTVAAADDVDIAGSAGDDQAKFCALALDQGVDGDGRAVDQMVDCGRFEAGLANAIDDALDGIGGSGEAFGVADGLGALVERDQIGEGAVDIHSDPQAHSVVFLPKCSAGRRAARSGDIANCGDTSRPEERPSRGHEGFSFQRPKYRVRAPE